MVEMYLDGLNDLLKGLPGGETLGKLGKRVLNIVYFVISFFLLFSNSVVVVTRYY